MNLVLESSQKIGLPYFSLRCSGMFEHSGLTCAIKLNPCLKSSKCEDILYGRPGPLITSFQVIPSPAEECEEVMCAISKMRCAPGVAQEGVEVAISALVPLDTQNMGAH